ncbi:hypothetical protein LEMLEM_LOCUS824, partial [Lemmus lemmus]
KRLSNLAKTGIPLLFPVTAEDCDLAQRTLQKRRQKKCKSHSGWRTPRKQDPINQLIPAHMNSQRRRQNAQ